MVVNRQRQIRSDSLANRERILAAATRLFGERGVDVPLDEIAVIAGVGSATLHRHFRGRVELVHSVLDAEANRLAVRANNLLLCGDSHWVLRTWLLELIQFTNSFRGLAVLLADHDADTTWEARHRVLTGACQRLLAVAQADGCIRSTLEVGDLLKLAHGIAVAAGESVEVASRLLDLVTNGLRPCSVNTG